MYWGGWEWGGEDAWVSLLFCFVLWIFGGQWWRVEKGNENKDETVKEEG